LRLGIAKANYGAARSIHGTAFMSAKDYYEILGVSKNAPASEVKKAYHGLAKKLHPDLSEDPQAATKFQEVQKAYEVLSNEEKRSLYDQIGHEGYEQAATGGGPSGGPDSGAWGGMGGNPFDMFENLVNPFREMGGSTVKVAVELSFMEAVQGCTKTVTYNTELPCESCGGTGVPPGTKPETCKNCRGSGMTMHSTGMFRIQTTCITCSGSGKVYKNLCHTCNGRRVLKGPKSVKLNIMPGVDNDETIKVPRAGGVDPDGNPPGDLLVFVKVRDDPVFRREGPDIHVDAVLSITQAILGGTIQVPTLTGDVVLKVRPGTQPGQKVVLKKKGIKTRSSYTYGDQFIHFNVSIPTNLTQRQRQLIEEFVKEERRGEWDKKTAAAGASSG
jgi:molecular chaperone DnaJ